MAKRGPKKPGKRLPQTHLAEGMVYFFEHLNGKTFAQMAKEYNRDPATVSSLAKRASDQMVLEAKERIMAELLPTVIALQKARMEWEIAEIKEGRMPEKVNHSDRFMKGMFLFDDKPVPQKEGPQQLAPGEEEVSTLAGLVATRQRRMAQPPKELPNTTTKEEENVIDVEAIPTDKA